MRQITVCILSLCIALMAGACTTTKGSSSTAADDGYEQSYEETNFYYEFDDILIPKELSFQSEDSYTFDTDNFKMGVLVFEGRVNNQDLINFFINNMAKDNWHLETSLKSAKSVLVFDKPNKSCVIQITDGFTSTATVLAVEHKPAGDLAQ